MITQAQREERRTGLGGSDIAGIIPDPDSPTGFVSPFTTEVEVWNSKLHPEDTEKEETEAMYWGNAEEDLVARRFTQLTGKRVVNHNRMIHDGCLLANLDRLIIPDGAKIAAHMGEIRTNELFEAKTSGKDWNPADTVEELPNGCKVLDGEAGIPRYYLTQCNHYLGRVLQADKIYVAVKMAIPMVFFARTDFRIYVLRRDQELIDMQDAFAREWWDRYIVKGDKPEPRTEGDCKILWRRSRPETSITLTNPLFTAWNDLRTAKQMLKDAEEAKAKAETELKKAMGEKESILGPDGKTVLATWKSAKDKTVTTVDWESVARSLNPTESELAAVETTWESLAKAKGATEEQIAAATTTVVKPGSRSFLPKFTDKIIKYAATIDPAALPAPETPQIAATDAPAVTEGQADAKAEVAA